MCLEAKVNSNDTEKSANDPRVVATPVQNPASQPHGTTLDQVNEMESEGQATKQGQRPNPSPPGTQATQMPDQKNEKRNTTNPGRPTRAVPGARAPRRQGH